MKVWPWLLGGGLGAWLLWPKKASAQTVVVTEPPAGALATSKILELTRTATSVEQAQRLVATMNAPNFVTQPIVACYGEGASFVGAKYQPFKGPDGVVDPRFFIVSFGIGVTQDAYMRWRYNFKTINACADANMTVSLSGAGVSVS